MMGHRDVISACLGDWGPWHLRTVLLIFLVKIPAAWFMACLLYTAPMPRHGDFHCRPPEPTTDEGLNQSAIISLLHPILPSPTNEHDVIVDFCNVYKNVWDYLHGGSNSTTTSFAAPYLNFIPGVPLETMPCDEFEHQTEFTSIITDYDLVCSKDVLVATTQSFHLLGIVCGGLVATKMLTTVSPRRIMAVSMYAQLLCGVLTGYATNYGLHIFFRCLSAVTCSMMITAGTVIRKSVCCVWRVGSEL